MIRSRMLISVLLRRSASKTGTNVRERLAVSPRRPRQPVALDAEVVVAEESHRSDDDQPHDQHLVLVAEIQRDGAGEETCEGVREHRQTCVRALDLARKNQGKCEDDREVQHENWLFKPCAPGHRTTMAVIRTRSITLATVTIVRLSGLPM